MECNQCIGNVFLPFSGSVLNVETVQIARNLLGSPDENFWSEVGLRKAEYSFFIRVFVIRSVDPELIRLGMWMINGRNKISLV